MPSFVPNELVTRDDWDPHRMNRYLKNLIVVINDFYKIFFLPFSNMNNHVMLKNLQNQLIQSIDIAKQKYLNKVMQNLCDSLTTTKCS